jgi:hypothetical protein
MARLVSKNCPTCGAPLPFAPDAKQVVCQYCGNLIQIEWTRHVPQPQGPSMTLYVKPPTPSYVIWIIVLTTVIPTVLGIIISIVGVVGSVSATRTTVLFPGSQLNLRQLTGGTDPSATVQNFPVTCGMNQEIQIVGKVYKGTGTLITGGINCKILIKDSQLTSDIIVEGKNLVDVTIENSTLTGNEVAIKYEMNSKVRITKNSVVRGKEAAILGGLNAEISIADSRVEAEESAIRCDSNPKMETKNATITGKEYGVRSGVNLKLTMTGGAINGARAALIAEMNLDLEMRGGVMQGAEVGLLVSEGNADLKTSKGARFVGREAAIKVGSNLKMESEETVVDSREIGIETEHNPKLKLEKNTKIHGGNIALKVGYNMELSMRQASVKSEGIGICMGYNTKIQARGSTIEGSQDALRATRRPDDLTLVDTKIVGKQNFSGKGCDVLPGQGASSATGKDAKAGGAPGAAGGKLKDPWKN